MIDTRPVFHQLRLVLQADTAHGIQCGRGDATHDVLLVRDANGLPAIPATSLAGVLRHRFAQLHGQAQANALFGTLEGEGQPSWLQIDWGLVHDSQNQPHEGLLDPAKVQADPLLEWLSHDKPLVRQRVRLNHRGSAEDAGKFDVTLVPAGVRYTHWLGYWRDGSEASAALWQQLLALLAQGELHLGHGTHAGNGRFQVIALEGAHWDLRTAEGRKGFQNRPRLRRDAKGLSPLALDPAGYRSLTVQLQLQAEAGWRIGGGEHSLNDHTDKLPDMLPQHEPCVVWSNTHKASLQTRWYLLPGSAIKGALRHRVAFHDRRMAGQWANPVLDSTEENPAVRELFGHADKDDAQAGLLQIPDLHLEPGQTTVLMHNRIDRYTGGVIDGGLFSEEVLYATALSLQIQITDRRTPSARARQALQHALIDLAQGRLPLGAGGSRGLGTFIDPTGQGPCWSDNGAWLQAAPAQEEHCA